MVLTVGLAGVDCGCDITAVSSDQVNNDTVDSEEELPSVVG